MTKKINFLLALSIFFIANTAMSNNVIEPFSTLTWQDSLAEAVAKINKIKGIESVKLIVGRPDNIDITGINNKTDLEKRINTERNAKDEHGFPRLICLSDEFHLRDTIKNNKELRKGLVEIPFELEAKPIIIADIPFTMCIGFENYPGLLVKSPDKVIALHSKKYGDFFAPLVMVGVYLVSEAPSLDNNLIKLKNIVKKKYNRFDKVSKGYDEKGRFKMEVKDADGRRFKMIANLSSYMHKCTIIYRSSVHTTQLDKIFNEYLSNLDREKHKDKKDMASDL